MLYVVKETVPRARVEGRERRIDVLRKRSCDVLAFVRNARLGGELVRDIDHALGKIDTDDLFGALAGERDAETARAAADVENFLSLEGPQLFDIQLQAFLNNAAPIVVDKGRKRALLFFVNSVEPRSVIVKNEAVQLRLATG